MNRPPAFLFYAKDWLSSAKIATMTLEEVGGYTHLLAHEWLSQDCTLPDDDTQLAALSRMGERWLSYPPGMNPVRNCFTPHPSKQIRLINKRLYAEWKNLRAIRKERTDSGRKGAQSRWKVKNRTDSSANGSAIAQLLVEGMAKNGSSSPISSSILKKEKDTSLNGHGDSFKIFWEHYPRKIGKGHVENAWAKIQPDDVLLGVMLAKIEQAKQSPLWTKDHGKFIKHPATWLNSKGWEDDYSVPHMKLGRIPL